MLVVEVCGGTGTLDRGEPQRHGCWAEVNYHPQTRATSSQATEKTPKVERM
jgi:hypothetical protein